MELKIYNSLTRKKEKFEPINQNKVNMYACGITVSGDAHIGHLFQALIYDIIRKYLVKSGYNVTYARNYTDIDDKIILNANKQNIDPKLFAENKIKEIDDDMNYFQVDEPNLWLRATHNVDNIIEFIQVLINKGYAYNTPNGDVYFSVAKFNNYGKLSNRNLDDAKNGVRISNDEQKENPLDFALWKSAKPGEPFWNSPWGNGRPGWHIECSVMNMQAFGEQIDIHGGGRDLVFPHHENEIAQTEAYTGKQFVKYWTHNGLIKVDGQKMSKSLGNTILLKDLRKNQHPEVVKFAMLQNSYRNDINFTDALFKEAENHILEFNKIIKSVNDKFGISNEINPIIDEEFNNSMDDDFNTAKAFANLYGYFKTINKKLQSNDSSAATDVNSIIKTYSLLGLFVNPAEEIINYIESKRANNIPSEIIEIAEARKQARLNKDYKTSDELRDKIISLGYSVLDKAGNEYELVKN